MSKTTIKNARQLSSAKAPTDTRKVTYTITMKGIAKGTLLLKVTHTGTKTFYTRALINRKRIDVRLGNYPIVSLKEAVNKHNNMMSYVEKGIDPRSILRAEKQRNIDSLTMDELFQQWFKYAKATSQSKEETLRAHKWRWNEYISPSIGNIFAKDLTRMNLMAVFDKSVLRSREQARKAYTTVNLPLDYAMARSLITENPARTIKPKDFNATRTAPRDRKLALEEITELQNLLCKMEKHNSPQMIGIIRIALLTGARRSEVCNMRWTDLSFDDDVLVWNIASTKNGRPHRIFLHEYGQSIIEHLKPLTMDSGWVFESPRVENAPIRPDAVTTFIRRLNRVTSFPHFSLHDLRRTAASYWADKFKVDSALIELMLNHLPANELVRTYQVIKREDDQKYVWKRWDHLLNQLLEYPS